MRSQAPPASARSPVPAVSKTTSIRSAGPLRAEPHGRGGWSALLLLKAFSEFALLHNCFLHLQTKDNRGRLDIPILQSLLPIPRKCRWPGHSKLLPGSYPVKGESNITARNTSEKAYLSKGRQDQLRAELARKLPYWLVRQTAENRYPWPDTLSAYRAHTSVLRHV